MPALKCIIHAIIRREDGYYTTLIIFSKSAAFFVFLNKEKRKGVKTPDVRNKGGMVM